MNEKIKCPRCKGTGKVVNRNATIGVWLRDLWAERRKEGITKTELARQLSRQRHCIPGLRPGDEWVAYNHEGWRAKLAGIEKETAPSDEAQGGEG